jgi:hypothetical protein
MYSGSRVSGISFGESGKGNSKICHSENELYNLMLEDEIFGNVLNDIIIIWNNM